MNIETVKCLKRVLMCLIVGLMVGALAAAENAPPTDDGGEILFNVRLGPYASRAEADAIVEQLQREGVEFFLFPRRSDGSWEISVGMFRQSANASKRMLWVEMLGISPLRTIEVRRRGLDAPDEIPASIDRSLPAPVLIEPPHEKDTEVVVQIDSQVPPDVSLDGVLTPSSGAAIAAPPGAPAETPGPVAEIGVSRVPGARVMTIDQALAYALEHSPELEEETLQVALRQSDVKLSKSFIYPRIDFRHTSTWIDTETADRFNSVTDGLQLILDELGQDVDVPPFLYEESHRTRVLVNQNLFAGGGNVNRISAAKEGLAAAQSSREDREVLLVAQVHGAFFGLTRQEHEVRLREDSLARAQRFLDSIRRRFTLGLEARAEVLRWDVQVAGERSRLIQAANRMFVGQEHFKRLIGFPSHEALELSWPTEREVDLWMAQGMTVIEHSADGGTVWLDDHPAVIAANHALEAARRHRRVAKAAYWPRLDVGGSVGYIENPTLSFDEILQWNVRLDLSLSVWDGGVRGAETSRAQTEERRAELKLEILREDLFISERSIEADLRADLAELENATVAVEQAKVNLRIISDKRELGLSGNIDLIDAQVVLTQSEVAKSSARFKYLIDLARWFRVREPDLLTQKGLQ